MRKFHKLPGLLTISLLFLSLPFACLHAQEKSTTPDGNQLPRGSFVGVNSTIPSPEKKHAGAVHPDLPCYSADEMIIRHEGYTLSYNKKHKQANWVAYTLTVEKTNARVKREDNFVPDPMITEGASSNDDYKKSGYDKGHLAPCGDMCYSRRTMEESFYLSNMSPQEPGFNRGIWKNLETLVRQWAIEDSLLCIATAGVLAPGLPAIGKNKVSVPKLYYKVIVDAQGEIKKGIGFIIPNEKTRRPLQDFIVSIDSVESLTGIDFFCSLPDDLEAQLEGNSDQTEWNWLIINKKGTKNDE